MEEMLMTRPQPRSYIPGNAFCTILKGASSMILSIIEKRSGGNSSTAATYCRPALLTTMSALTDGPDVIETSFMSLLHLEETACPRQDLSPMRYREPVYSVVQRAFAFYTTSYVSTSADNKPLEV